MFDDLGVASRSGRPSVGRRLGWSPDAGRVAVTILAAILVASLEISCASSLPTSDSARDSVLLDALAERGDPLDMALVASGYESFSALEDSRVSFESVLTSLLDKVRVASDDRSRGQALLAALHAPGGPLKTYDARATTLENILKDGRFNCVSASVVFNLAAERAGLRVLAQLLPTHARSLLAVEGREGPRNVVVETTSPAGFDPDEAESNRILEDVGAREGTEESMVPDEGTTVETRVLIGTIYVNRASIEQESGNLERAEKLFARGEAFADDQAMKQVLRDQRAALLSQLAADDVLSSDADKIARAVRTLKAAMALAPEQPRIRAAVEQNLRAAAERLIAQVAKAGDERALEATVEQVIGVGLKSPDEAGLRAFAFSEMARLCAVRDDFEGALVAIASALAQKTEPKDAKLTEIAERNRIAIYRLGAVTSAKRGDLSSAWSYLDRLAAQPEVTDDDREVIDDDRQKVVHLAAQALIESDRLDAAAEVYRLALRRHPKEGAFRSNLAAVLERIAAPIANGSSCLEAERWLEEIQVLSPSSSFPRRARVSCLTRLAEDRMAARDFEEAISLLRAARKETPSDRAVSKNLAMALLRWAESLSKPERCARAKALAREARTLVPGESLSNVIQRALRGCRSDKR